MHPHVLREAHGLQHLGPEHPTVTNLYPLLQLWVESEDLERRLRSILVSKGKKRKRGARDIPRCMGYTPA